MLEKWVEDHFKDLSVYRFGGQTLLDGLPLYEGADPTTVLPFTYPPFAALLFVPLTVLPWPVLVAAWSAASFAALVLVCRVYGVRGRWLPVGVAAASLALEPVWSTFTLGQVNLFLLLLVSADLLRGIDRRWGGVLIGIAAGIKLTPLIFIVFLVLVGRRDVALRAVGALAGTVAVGFVVVPKDAVEFWTHAVLDPGRVGGVSFARNQSVLALLTRLLGEEPSKLVWLLVAGPLALGVLLLARRAWLRDDRPLAVVLVGLAMLLASPISWSHHWVWVVPALIVLVRSGTSYVPRAIGTASYDVARSGRWVGAGVIAAVFASCCILWPPSKDDRELSWTPLEQAAGNAYLWVALAVLLAPTAPRFVSRANVHRQSRESAWMCTCAALPAESDVRTDGVPIADRCSAATAWCDSGQGSTGGGRVRRSARSSGGVSVTTLALRRCSGRSESNPRQFRALSRHPPAAGGRAGSWRCGRRKETSPRSLLAGSGLAGGPG